MSRINIDTEHVETTVTATVDVKISNSLSALNSTITDLSNTVNTLTGATSPGTDESSIPDEVGSIKRGGVIYYVFSEGETGYVEGETHGLVAALTDLPYNYPFMYATFTGNTTATDDFLVGSANTDELIADINANEPGVINAAKAARAYKGGGFTDWYLPSRKEMNFMCPAVWSGVLYNINTASEESTENKPYWTSSTYEGGVWGYFFYSNLVKEVDWNNGDPGWYGWGGSDEPATNRLVRPIRSF